MAGHFLWVLVWTGACYWHGVGGFMFNSSSFLLCNTTTTTTTTTSELGALDSRLVWARIATDGRRYRDTPPTAPHPHVASAQTASSSSSSLHISAHHATVQALLRCALAVGTLALPPPASPSKPPPPPPPIAGLLPSVASIEGGTDCKSVKPPGAPPLPSLLSPSAPPPSSGAGEAAPEPSPALLL